MSFIGAACCLTSCSGVSFGLPVRCHNSVMPGPGRLVAICLASLLATYSQAGAQVAAGSAKDLYARAVALEAKGDDSAALSLFWQAAGLAPRDPDIQNSLGEALLRMGALDAAIDAFTRAVAERPAFQKGFRNLVGALGQAGRGPEAVAKARAFAAADPGDLERRFTLGLALSEQDLEAAMETFRDLLTRAPRHALARYNLALVLQRADRQAEAIEELGRVIEIEPRPEAYYTLGVIYWHQGKLERAADALRAAIEVDPRYAAAHYTLGAVLKDRRDWTGAARALRQATALRPDLAGAYVTLAQVLRMAGDEAGARAQLAEGERLRQRAQKEHEALVWTAVGTSRMDTGDLVGAVDALRRATTIFDAYAPAHYQLGRVFQRLGQPEASRAAFARARQLNPTLLPPQLLP